MMHIRITRTTKFAHPNPKMYTRPHLVTKEGDVVTVDDEQGQFILDLGFGVLVSEREVEVRAADTFEVPVEPEFKDAAQEDALRSSFKKVVSAGERAHLKDETEAPVAPPKKKRGRPPGKRTLKS